MTIKKFIEPSAVISFAAASALAFGSALSPVGAAVATSNGLETLQTAPTTEVKTAGFWSKACSVAVWAGTLGTATGFNYRVCMS